MNKYNLAILGCGAIFSRHIAAINFNSDYYKLIGVFDPNPETIKLQKDSLLGIKIYNSEDEVYSDEVVNCIVILTPSYLHYQIAIKSLDNNKHVIIEKPATFYSHELNHIIELATKKNLNVFGVLQVRLNPSVIIAKTAIEKGCLGLIRGVSLVQRWQRPLSYFIGWRGSMETCGGVIREFSIHYLDILQYLVGLPKVLHSSFYNTKFTNTNISDTIYALFDFNKFGGSFEISIAAEPKNIECTLSILTDKGFLKLGGKSLDEIIAVEFNDSETMDNFLLIKNSVLENNQSLTALTGASPYHPELYKQIFINPSSFHLKQTFNVIKLIEGIYENQDK